MRAERTGRGLGKRLLAAALSAWLAIAPVTPSALRTAAIGGAVIVVSVDEAQAQRRSSGGYSRPSTRTPSFSGRSYAPRRPSTSGGYTRPSAPVYVPRQAPSQSQSDRAMQRRGSQDALDLFRGRSGASGQTGSDRGAIAVPQGPLVRERTPSTRSTPSYRYRQAPATAGGSAWQPPAFAQGGRFGAWDAMLLWFLLDTLNRPGHARAFHDNQNDPGVQAWRQEADRRAADDPALKARLDELDRQTAALAGEAQQPGRLPPDVARTDGGSGGGFGGILLTVALLGAFAFITWRFFRRRRTAPPTPKGAEMGPIDVARGILSRKLDQKSYNPSFFRVGMTFPFDPTPFLMAAGTTQVTGPAGGGGNNLVSVAAVGRIEAGDVEMHRLYLAGSDGWFQLWLGADGRPEECRWFQPIDEVHPADREEWAFWMDEREGMVGWPEFQTKDGTIYGRHWLPGDRRVAPREWTETIQDARGTTSRQVHAMLYSRATGAPTPAPDAEYILVSVIEGDGEAYVEIAAGIDVNPASLTIA
ncbi:hypothetical protein STAQ_16080 [Allostella sp. ATCC 35155]|nr:hypothetical protein STAQ_16080 [Stella sp. ATCC 35155]